MKKYIGFFQKLSLKLKGYMYTNRSVNTGEKEIFCEKFVKGNYLKLFFDGIPVYDDYADTDSFMYTPDSVFVMDTEGDIFNISFKLIVISFKDNTKSYISGLNTMLEPAFLSNKYYIIERTNRMKAVITSTGEMVIDNISDVLRVTKGKFDAIIFKAEGYYYFVNDDFKNMCKYSYITQFGSESKCFIGIDYDPNEKRKYYYFINDPKEIGRTTSYKNISPLEDGDNVTLYMVVTEMGKKNIINEDGEDLFCVDFIECDKFVNGVAFCSVARRGKGIARKDGSIVFGDIKRKIFGFREVKYGVFTEYYAGVQTFDGDAYIDTKGALHMIYNRKRFDEYELEEKKKENDE